jgi:two-component system, chemotaxis family, chemotaxis protein CheY
MKPNILIVEDSPTIRKMIMASLKPLEASFIEAGTGLEAMERLTQLRYDVITLDLNMPDMHGLEFLQFLKSQNSFKDIPVIVVTTHGEDLSRKVLEAGADKYIAKPFTPGDIMNAVKELLDGR